MIERSTTPKSTAIDLAAIEAKLRSEFGNSPEKLKFRFYECYNGAAEFIAEAALCIKILHEHGNEYLTGMPMVGTYRRIASGQVAPELFWKFIESPNRQRVERLPLEDQRRIAEDPMVEVVEPKPGGGFDKRRVDIRTAPADVAKLVAGPDGIRSPEEQLQYIGSQKPSAAVAAKRAREDEDREYTEPLDHSMTVPLSATEVESIKIHAAKAHLSNRDMLRRFLAQAGAFKKPKV